MIRFVAVATPIYRYSYANCVMSIDILAYISRWWWLVDLGCSMLWFWEGPRITVIAVCVCRMMDVSAGHYDYTY
jgi:hypothetical protein